MLCCITRPTDESDEDAPVIGSGSRSRLDQSLTIEGAWVETWRRLQ